MTKYQNVYELYNKDPITTYYYFDYVTYLSRSFLDSKFKFIPRIGSHFQRRLSQGSLYLCCYHLLFITAYWPF